MLDKLMTVMQRGGVVTLEEVARELGTTSEVAAGMLEHLARAGWLRDLTSDCGRACGGCALARECGSGKRGRVWQMSRQAD